MQFPILCISVGTTLLLALSSLHTEPYDRSVLDLITSIGVAAIALCAVHQCYPSVLSPVQKSSGQYDAIPLDELRENGTPREKQLTAPVSSTLSVRNQVALIAAAIGLLTIRIELYRKISETAQCTTRSYEVLIPLVLAVNECRYQQRLKLQADTGPDGSVYDALLLRFKSLVLNPVWRYIPSALAITYGTSAMSGVWEAQRSTFICPIASGESFSIPKLQKSAAVLDGILLVIAQEIARSNNSSSYKMLSVPFSYANILLGTFFAWTALTFGRYVAKQEGMQWLLVNDTPSSYVSLWFMTGQSILFSVFVLSSTYCILYYGVYQLSALLAASTALFLGVSNLWSAGHPFPPNTSNVSIWSFIVTFLGAWSSYRIAQAVGSIQPSRSSTWQVLSFIGLIILIAPSFWASDGVYFHPIDLLMFEAKAQHERYVTYASESTDLQTAVAVYRERYQCNPPPGFDQWYRYAREKSVLVVDDFDQIHRDLLPFRTVSPSDLRRQTWEVVSNPWNEISGISIRNGKAEVQENVLPTHRWMLEGVAELINSFAQYLPDMDLAFNLNDESRVAVPHDKIVSLQQQAAQIKFETQSTWSSDRASTWIPTAKEDYGKTVFENFSFQKNFRRFGTIGCAANSLSHTQPHLSSQSHLCLQCLAPHSLGQFVSNWTLAGDMCHQPDMSHLHGFYLSPAAFKTTYELMPVFSQSKASGYNDILYPTSWNYMDKAVYKPTNGSGVPGAEDYLPPYLDPPFAQKDNVLFWRGATSEGLSGKTGVWRGMTRQRLVHLANNASSDLDHDRITILLPDQAREEEYTYHSLPGSALSSLGIQHTTDIRIVNKIDRCWDGDCTDQEQEFGLVGPVDFQSHWKYRFLFDLDGAAFSGRFLPFLQSRSLPFKTALFREWYDSRITAWRHFVPIDMRLHGVWSTLAYFAGVDGVWPGTGKLYKWEAHVRQGEIIAEEGRRWAGQVLRKEDMEVYFFRLLLEWGRLTDDKRDELGFVAS